MTKVLEKRLIAIFDTVLSATIKCVLCNGTPPGGWRCSETHVLPLYLIRNKPRWL